MQTAPDTPALPTGPAFIRHLTLDSPAATSALGAGLAALLRPGDVVLLRGPVGAGKSHLARAIIQTRLATSGRSEDVPSPTFTLVQTYDDGAAEFWHADLYRLTHADEALELGLLAAFDSAICLIEWPDILGPDLPADALSVTLGPAPQDGARALTLGWDAPGWAARLSPLLATFAPAER